MTTPTNCDQCGVPADDMQEDLVKRHGYYLCEECISEFDAYADEDAWDRWDENRPSDALDVALDEQWMADHEAGDIGPAPWKGEF
jgi:hypothetical protein